jgi:hypothetical protein
MTIAADNRNACIQYQAYYNDNFCQHVGTTPFAPVENEMVDHYRARFCNHVKRQYLRPDRDLRNVGFHELSRQNMTAFTTIERQLLDEARVDALDPATVPLGEIRAVPIRDPLTNHVKEIRYIGQEHFTKQIGRPGRKVVSFLTMNGPVSASGMFLR